MSDNSAPKKNYGSEIIGQVHAVPLELINATYNYRVVFPTLAKMDYKYISLLRMGMSDDPAERQEFVNLVETHESVPEKDGEMTVIALADNIREFGQIQPISVQQLGTTNHKDAEGNVIGKKYGYGIISGSHRVMAMVYNWAKYGFVLSNSKHYKKPFIKATLDRVDKSEAVEKSMSENMLRKDPSEYEIGKMVAAMLETGKSFDQIVQKYGRTVSYYKACLAIFQPTVKGVDGKEIMEKLKRKEITKAEALATVTGKSIAPSRMPKALRMGDGASNSRSGPVNKVCSYAEVVRKIVETDYDGKPTSTMRIRTLGEVINLSLDDTIKLRDERLKKTAGKTA